MWSVCYKLSARIENSIQHQRQRLDDKLWALQFERLLRRCASLNRTYRVVPKFSPYDRKAYACAPRLGLPPPASRVRRSRRVRDTLAAAPGLLAHASVTEAVNICLMRPKLCYTAVLHVSCDSTLTVSCPVLTVSNVPFEWLGVVAACACACMCGLHARVLSLCAVRQLGC
jgi:hypothetical protein